MANELKCPICGEPTRVYMGHARKDLLCGKHADLLKAGKLTLDANGKPIDAAVQKTFEPATPKPAFVPKTDTTAKPGTKCLICGEDSNGKELCIACYKEVMNKQEELDKNQKPWELKDYFYNLNSSIYRLNDSAYAKGQLYKLYAIAWLVRDLYKDEQLSDVVGKYVQKLVEARKNTKEFKITEDKARSDKATVAVTNLQKNRASDGHICKSQGEVIIDNILFNYGICHAYGLKVKEIPATHERTIEADWYIPLAGSSGIYVEYWGMDKQDYQDNKEEKLKLYKKYEGIVKLIEIEKNDTNDIQSLEYNLYQKLLEFGWRPNR